MYKFCIKRIFDFVLAFVCLILLLPIFIPIMIFLFFANNGSPFFFQLRPGKNERLFNIIKFKTMNDKKGADGKLLPDAERLTKVGSFVRKTSMDEIPQLINVVKGDMSLIGPRPLLPEYLDLYNEEQKRRHNVRPGISGWAQVNGRNSVGWIEKFKFDVYYVDNFGFALDIKIILKTVLKVFKSEGISSSPESVSMEAFKGN